MILVISGGRGSCDAEGTKGASKELAVFPFLAWVAEILKHCTFFCMYSIFHNHILERVRVKSGPVLARWNSMHIKTNNNKSGYNRRQQEDGNSERSRDWGAGRSRKARFRAGGPKTVDVTDSLYNREKLGSWWWYREFQAAGWQVWGEHTCARPSILQLEPKRQLWRGQVKWDRSLGPGLKCWILVDLSYRQPMYLSMTYRSK